MTLHSALVGSFTSMADFGSDTAKTELRQEAANCTLDKWKNLNRKKTGGAGLLSGVFGGPWSVAAEGADLAYLLRTGARAAIGIGHVLGKDVSHEEDMNAILAIWSGAAEAANHVATGKFAIKLGGKMGLQMGATTAATITVAI